MERQVVQLTLLVLLASIFFSGLIIPVADLSDPVQAGAGVLPATHTIRLLQDLMLTGYTNSPSSLGYLSAIAVFGLGIAWMLLRRGMSRT